MAPKLAPTRLLLLLAACAAFLAASNACPFAGSMRDEAADAVDGAGRKLLQANNCNINALVQAGPHNPSGPKTPTASIPALVKVREIALIALRDGGSGVPGIRAAGVGINRNVPHGALLRMVFHDCGTCNYKTGRGGCNGSIQREINLGPNTGRNLNDAMALLRRWQALINLRIAADKSGVIPAGTRISMADTVVLAGVVVVGLAGGPNKSQLYDKIEMGRVDLRSPAIDDVNRLPSRNLNYQGVVCWYLNAGYTVQDTVAATGAHDLGFVRGRLPMSSTPYTWNGDYFSRVLSGTGAFASDNALASRTGLTRRYVQSFASNPTAFSNAFVAFYLRMANMCATWSH